MPHVNGGNNLNQLETDVIFLLHHCFPVVQEKSNGRIAFNTYSGLCINSIRSPGGALCHVF